MTMRRMVKMHFKAGSIDAFIDFFESKKELIASFPGCHHVELLRDSREPDILYTYSLWDSEEALEDYRRSELFRSIWKETKLHFTSPASAWSMDLMAKAGMRS